MRRIFDSLIDVGKFVGCWREKYRGEHFCKLDPDTKRLAIGAFAAIVIKGPRILNHVFYGTGSILLESTKSRLIDICGGL